MRQIVAGVFELRVGFVNVHLVVVDDGVVLIDTGLPGRRAAARIESALRDVRRAVGAVTHILLTHKHPDHTGGVAELRRRSGARVVAHEADAPVMPRMLTDDVAAADPAVPLRHAHSRPYAGTRVAEPCRHRRRRHELANR